MTNAHATLNAALSGRYTIERELGAGGMATVYLAHDIRHDRKVALKVLRPELSAILGAQRFLAEIKTTANLQHPHILSLFDSGEADGTVFYVMPYVEGESLRDRIKREQQLPIDDAIRIAREVLDALEYAHQHNVVHRDIKPENILLHGGHAMVADFGIALAASKVDSGTRMTETGMSLGTPHYMSPEQAMGERNITGKADIYAAGAVLYEMLTGEPPFTGQSAQAVFARVLTDDPRPLTLQRKTIPSHVADAVQMALQKLPADRFASAEQFADALGKPGFVAPHTQSARATAATSRVTRTTLALAATAIIAVLAALAGWLRPTPEEPVTRFTVLLDEGQILGSSEQSRVALSPDASLLVYDAIDAATNRLLMRRRDALKAEPISATETATNPFFSPDGTKLGFVTSSPRALHVMLVSGGPRTTIADSLVDFGGATWGYDGYVYYDGHFDGDGIARVRETGGEPEQVTRADSADGELWHFQPEALPNGRGLLFTVAVRFGGLSGEWWVGGKQVGGGKHTRLVRGRLPRFAQGHLFYVTDEGVLMAVPFDEDRLELRGEAVPVVQGVGARFLGQADVSISRNGTLAYSTGFSGSNAAELLWVTRDGRVTPVDSNFRRGIVRAQLSPDGRRAVLSVQDGERVDVWVKELDRGPAVRISFDDSRNHVPTWSSDGNSVYFNARTLGQTLTRLMRATPDGSALPVPVRSVAEINVSMLAPRHGWVFKRTATAFEAAQVTGDTIFRRIVDDPGELYLLGLSPNGKWLAYVTGAGSASNEIYVRPFPDTRSAKRVVSNGGIGSWAGWSPMGDELFYLNRANQMIAVPMRPGVVPVLGEPRVLFNLVDARLQSQFDIEPSPDGKRFLVTRPATSGTRDEIVVVENFMSEVRAKAKR